jgi:hypothetical protein
MLAVQPRRCLLRTRAATASDARPSCSASMLRMLAMRSKNDALRRFFAPSILASAASQ